MNRTSDNRTLYPVFRRLLYLKRPITGHKRPVIGRLLYLKRLKTGYKRPVFRRFGTKTGSKPVLVDSDDWNRLQTGFGSKTGRYIRFSDV